MSCITYYTSSRSQCRKKKCYLRRFFQIILSSFLLLKCSLFVESFSAPATSAIPSTIKNGNTDIASFDVDNDNNNSIINKRITKNSKSAAATTTKTTTGKKKKVKVANTKIKKRRRRPMKFHVMVKQLKKYRNNKGHSLVTESDDPQLFKWTQQIRKNYKYQYKEILIMNNNKKEDVNGGPSSDNTCISYDSNTTSDINDSSTKNEKKTKKKARLSDEKMALLTELEFCWEMRVILWPKQYEQICRYREEYGHCQVPVRKCMQYPGLGVWVQNQRREYKLYTQGERSQLTTSRIQKLESIDFQWYKSREEAWKKKYQQLVEYSELYGHSDVPEKYNYDATIGAFGLGTWCMNQRTERRKCALRITSTLTNKRIDLLEQLDFKWKLRESRWEQKLQRLQEYHEEHGDVRILPSDFENRDLRIWLLIQRHHYNRKNKRESEQASSMTQSRIDAIESAIPDFSWRGWKTDGPTVDDWGELFTVMRDKGIEPGVREKTHWFDGMNVFDEDIKTVYSDNELMDLWNEDEDEDEDDDEYGPVDS